MGDAGFSFGSPSGTPAMRSPSVDSRSPSTYSQRSGTRSPRTYRDKTLRDLVGNWALNLSLSTDVTNIRGTNGVSLSNGNTSDLSPPSNLSITQSHYPSQIFVKTASAAGIPNTERWFPPQRVGSWSEWRNTDSTNKSRCRWVKGSDFEHKEGIAYLTHGLARLGEFFEAEVESTKRESGRRSVQVWFVERGRLVRRMVRFDGDGGREEVEFVYEFAGR